MKQGIFNFIIFCFLFLSFYLFAQDTWIQTYQPFGDVDYFPEDIVVCQDGGYAVNGYYNYYDGMFYEEWGFLMKTDSEGNFLWADKDTLSFMGENRSYAFVETSNGDFINIGYSFTAGYMIKRDSYGNRIWAIPYNDFGANSMDNTDDGNIILGGNQNLNIGLRKINEAGNILWTQIHPINDDYSICNSIIQTQDGGYALTGYVGVSGTMTGDIIVMKTDANGDSLWTRSYDGYGGWDRGKSIIEDLNDNIMVAGEIQDPDLKGFLWYLDENGNTIWTQEVDSSIGYSHYSILSMPNCSFAAYCYMGNRESRIYNFDNSYSIQWESGFDGLLGRGDRSLKAINNKFICLLSEVGGYLFDNIGLAKTDSLGQITAIDNYEILNPKDTIYNYPNPFNPETTISFEFRT